MTFSIYLTTTESDKYLRVTDLPSSAKPFAEKFQKTTDTPWKLDVSTYTVENGKKYGLIEIDAALTDEEGDYQSTEKIVDDSGNPIQINDTYLPRSQSSAAGLAATPTPPAGA